MKPKLSQKILTGLALVANALLATPTQASETQLCEQLRHFANASSEREMHVELATNWGAKIEGNRVSIGEKRCTHSGGEAEKKLCAYLLPNTSTEFPAINFRRVLKCVQGFDAFASKAHVQLRELKLAFEKTALADSAVEIELELKPQAEAMLMRITAQRNVEEMQ